MLATEGLYSGAEQAFRDCRLSLKLWSSLSPAAPAGGREARDDRGKSAEVSLAIAREPQEDGITVLHHNEVFDCEVEVAQVLSASDTQTVADGGDLSLPSNLDVSLSIYELVSAAAPALDSSISTAFIRHTSSSGAHYPWTPSPIPHDTSDRNQGRFSRLVQREQVLHIDSFKTAGTIFRRQGTRLSWTYPDIRIPSLEKTPKALRFIATLIFRSDTTSFDKQKTMLPAEVQYNIEEAYAPGIAQDVPLGDNSNGKSSEVTSKSVQRSISYRPILRCLNKSWAQTEYPDLPTLRVLLACCSRLGESLRMDSIQLVDSGMMAVPGYTLSNSTPFRLPRLLRRHEQLSVILAPDSCKWRRRERGRRSLQELLVKLDTDSSPEYFPQRKVSNKRDDAMLLLLEGFLTSVLAPRKNIRLAFEIAGQGMLRNDGSMQLRHSIAERPRTSQRGVAVRLHASGVEGALVDRRLLLGLEHSATHLKESMPLIHSNNTAQEMSRIASVGVKYSPHLKRSLSSTAETFPLDPIPGRIELGRPSLYSTPNGSMPAGAAPSKISDRAATHVNTRDRDAKWPLMIGASLNVPAKSRAMLPQPAAGRSAIQLSARFIADSSTTRFRVDMLSNLRFSTETEDATTQDKLESYSFAGRQQWTLDADDKAATTIVDEDLLETSDIATLTVKPLGTFDLEIYISNCSSSESMIDLAFDLEALPQPQPLVGTAAVPLDTRLTIGPLSPGSCQVARAKFLALRPGFYHPYDLVVCQQGKVFKLAMRSVHLLIEV